MIEEAKKRALALENISWYVGKFEDVGARLDGPYDIIFGGDSLHWLDWTIAFSHFRRLLKSGGSIACVSRPFSPAAWQVDVQALVKRFTVVSDWEPYDLEAIWTKDYGFELENRVETKPEVHRKPIPEWLLAWHSASTLTRSRLSAAQTVGFDAEATKLLSPFERDGMVEAEIQNEIWWCRPGMQGNNVNEGEITR